MFIRNRNFLEFIIYHPEISRYDFHELFIIYTTEYSLNIEFTLFLFKNTYCTLYAFEIHVKTH